jgi:DNA-binding phage protein
MALTRDFKETILARVQRDPKFRQELLRDGVECLLSGEVATGKTILRDYINATVGFTTLGQETAHSPKSLMRMLGPSGNPNAENLLQIVAFLQKFEGVQFQVRAHKAVA